MSIEYSHDPADKAFCKNFAFFLDLEKKQDETLANVQSLQKALAAFREQFEDSRVEQAEDNAELKRQLQELKKRMSLLREGIA
jgi:hypothetical protein